MEKMLISLITIVSSGILWGVGGSSRISLGYRRIGVPAILAMYVMLYSGNLIASTLYGVILWSATTIGYGIPSHQDAGSPLGIFWYKIAEKLSTNLSTIEWFANLFTRITISICYSTPLMIIVWLVTHNILIGLMAILITIINTVCCSCLIQKQWDLGGINSEELFIGAGIAIGCVICLIG